MIIGKLLKKKTNMKHTNLPNEITGEYYEDKMQWYEYVAIIASLLIVVAFILAVVDQVFGAETVTYWIAELIS